MNSPEPSRDQVEELIESERAELGATVDELSRRLDPTTHARALGDRIRSLVQRPEVQAVIGAVFGAAVVTTVLRRRRRSRR